MRSNDDAPEAVGGGSENGYVMNNNSHKQVGNTEIVKEADGDYNTLIQLNCKKFLNSGAVNQWMSEWNLCRNATVTQARRCQTADVGIQCEIWLGTDTLPAAQAKERSLDQFAAWEIETCKFLPISATIKCQMKNDVDRVREMNQKERETCIIVSIVRYFLEKFRLVYYRLRLWCRKRDEGQKAMFGSVCDVYYTNEKRRYTIFCCIPPSKKKRDGTEDSSATEKHGKGKTNKPNGAMRVNNNNGHRPKRKTGIKHQMGPKNDREPSDLFKTTSYA
ncbi:hypothetical protein DdX_04788 [Ditylenchus destructor]|uniref:Uncharacterized protein n=1 Tax=Ditylenchus destructor TaxID=166010 RepID=A0AAD4RAF5_9BILA|nr:hypothetical protein DdX_04788 [Ditylenchus destructor]